MIDKALHTTPPVATPRIADEDALPAAISDSVNRPESPLTEEEDSFDATPTTLSAAAADGLTKKLSKMEMDVDTGKLQRYELTIAYLLLSSTSW